MDWLNSYRQALYGQVRDGVLPHALIISGMPGAGKSVLANWLVQLLACLQPGLRPGEQYASACGQCKACLLLAGQTYPDHQTVVHDGASIGVDDIRQVSLFLQKTAQLGRVKTVLLPDADKMTVAAANALLKTLEEPAPGSYILLLSQDVDSLLPTIVSRCRMLSIRPPTGNTLYAAVNVQQDDRFGNISQLPELTDAATKQDFEQFKLHISRLVADGQANMELADALVAQEHGLRWLEQYFVGLLRGQYGWQANNSQTNLPDRDKIWHSYQKIMAANQKLKRYTQANRTLVCQQLLMELEQVLTAKEH